MMLHIRKITLIFLLLLRFHLELMIEYKYNSFLLEAHSLKLILNVFFLFFRNMQF